MNKPRRNSSVVVKRSVNQAKADALRAGNKKLFWLFLTFAVINGGLLWYYEYYYIPPSRKILSITSENFEDGPIVSSIVDVKEVVDPLQKHPRFAPVSKEVLGKLEQYSELFEKAKKVSEGLHIDVILQDHGEEGTRDNLEVTMSQQKVFGTLRSGHYEVVGVEGVYIDPINLEGLVSSVLDHGRKYKIPMLPREELLKVVEADIPKNGGFRYITANSEVRGFGTEDYSLNHLHREILNDFQGQLKGTPSDVEVVHLNELNNRLSRLRSELAVVKMVLKLRSTGIAKGAIVMGTSHDNDMIKVLKHLHITGDIFKTH